MDNGNSVWDTLNKGIEAVANYQRVRVATQATPSGSGIPAGFNPSPWSAWSSFPQFDGKAGAPTATGTNPGAFMWVILGAVALVGLLFLRRG